MTTILNNVVVDHSRDVMKAASTEMKSPISRQLAFTFHHMLHPLRKSEILSNEYTYEDPCCWNNDPRSTFKFPLGDGDPGRTVWHSRPNATDGILVVLFKIPEYLFRLVYTRCVALQPLNGPKTSRSPRSRR